MSLHGLFHYLIAIFGTLAVLFAAFTLVFVYYSSIEVRVLRGIADYASEIYSYLDRMFIRQPLGRCYLLIIIPTIFFSLVGLGIGFSGGFFLGILCAFAFGTMGYLMPGMIGKTMFLRRVNKFDRQLVDALNMMANAIKSGLSFMQVIQVIEREMPSPCSEEFAMVLKENRVGINLNDALLNMTKRIPSDDLFMIINSVVTLSQQGGDLSEAFDTIATTIRERQRVQDKIRTLAQAGITQGMILSSLPLVMLGLQWFIQPNYVALLFTTTLGMFLLGIMVAMMIFGAIWMKKILTIEI